MSGAQRCYRPCLCCIVACNESAHRMCISPLHETAGSAVAVASRQQSSHGTRQLQHIDGAISLLLSAVLHCHALPVSSRTARCTSRVVSRVMLPRSSRRRHSETAPRLRGTTALLTATCCDMWRPIAHTDTGRPSSTLSTSLPSSQQATHYHLAASHFARISHWAAIVLHCSSVPELDPSAYGLRLHSVTQRADCYCCSSSGCSLRAV
jgi:hypothetical protein